VASELAESEARNQDYLNQQVAVTQAYRDVFRGHQGEIVLKDLRNECYVDRTTNAEGTGHSMQVLEGRRQVWLWIQRRLIAASGGTLAAVAEE